MALSKPRKKKFIRIVIIIVYLVDALVENDQLDSVQERVLRLVGLAEFNMNAFDDNEGNWTAEQSALASVVDAIDAAFSPEAVSQPTADDYERWEGDLEDAIAAL